MKNFDKVLLVGITIISITVAKLVSQYGKSLKSGSYVKTLNNNELDQSADDIQLSGGNAYILVKATDGKTYHAILDTENKKHVGESVTITNFWNGHNYLVR